MRQKSPITELDSIAIKVCRVMCIFFMCYVHVNPGRDFWPTEVPKHLSLLGFVLADVLGRTSVPALSVLSGYLAVAAYDRRRNWLAYAMDRWKVMIIPMLVWNALIMILSIVIWGGAGVQTAVLQHLGNVEELSPLLIVDRLTGYRYGSAISALNFLRDVFVCSLFLPVLRWLTRRMGIGAVGLVWLIGMTVGFSPIVMRPHIMMFFSVGVYLVIVARGDQLVPDLRTVVSIFAMVLLVFALVYFVPALQSAGHKILLDTAIRLLMASLFLIATVFLSRTHFGKTIARLEPLIFMMFLSHVVIFLLLWGVWQQVFEKDLEWPYAIFFVMAPVVTLLMLQQLQKGLARLPAALQKVLVGKASS